MAALWLQSVPLLVLLVVSCPGSQAAASPLRLCGIDLDEALYIVCGERGTFVNPTRTYDPCCHRPCSIFDLQSYCN